MSSMMSALVILTAVVGVEPLLGVVMILLKVSKPLVRMPKTEWSKFRCWGICARERSVSTMKNWESFVSSPLLAMASRPRLLNVAAVLIRRRSRCRFHGAVSIRITPLSDEAVDDAMEGEVVVKPRC